MLTSRRWRTDGLIAPQAEHFRAYGQQDVHEFIMFMLNKLDDELKPVFPAVPSVPRPLPSNAAPGAAPEEDGNPSSEASSVNAASGTDHVVGSRPQTMVGNVFRGELISTVLCHGCRSESQARESFDGNREPTLPARLCRNTLCPRTSTIGAPPRIPLPLCWNPEIVVTSCTWLLGLLRPLYPHFGWSWLETELNLAIPSAPQESRPNSSFGTATHERPVHKSPKVRYVDSRTGCGCVGYNSSHRQFYMAPSSPKRIISG